MAKTDVRKKFEELATEILELSQNREFNPTELDGFSHHKFLNILSLAIKLRKNYYYIKRCKMEMTILSVDL